jgi:hypothetical protein
MDIITYYQENYKFDLINVSGEFKDRISVVSLVPNNINISGGFGNAARKFERIDNKVQFLFCYYFSVLLDQAIHSAIREEHSTFDNLARYPKFCGILGSFHTNLHPALLLLVATLYTTDNNHELATEDFERLALFIPGEFYRFFTLEYPSITGRLTNKNLKLNVVYKLFNKLSDGVALLFQPKSLKPYSEEEPNLILFKRWINFISTKINEKCKEI